MIDIKLYIFLCSLLLISKTYFSFRMKNFNKRLVSARNCVGTIVKPVVDNNDFNKRDSDPSWETIGNKNIIPIEKDYNGIKPMLITFDAFGTLFEPSQGVGRWYREALNSVSEMTLRLPRPSFFKKSFDQAYNEMRESHPCFGSVSGMSSRDWWAEVISKTYKNTEFLTEIESDELDSIMPQLVDFLYDTVFSTETGWTVKEDVVYTLSKFRDWRDQGGGPKIGVVANFDSRLETILRELDLLKFFDFTISSYNYKNEKPSAQIFNEAARKACVSPEDYNKCFHIGTTLDSDVLGATSAGWQAMLYKEWFDDDFPDWFAVESKEDSDIGVEKRRKLMEWGRKSIAPETNGMEWMELWGLDDSLHLFGFPEDNDKQLKTTYIRSVLDDL